MELEERELILKRADKFFRSRIADKHAVNTAKCSKLSEFKVNPFTIHYLAAFAFGDESPRSLAKALLYPRALGTSIATTFGNNVQGFCTDVLQGYGSVAAGIDIEFDDEHDGRHKYCQLKAGPQTINKDDVVTITNHFKAMTGLARVNNLNDFNPMTDCFVGILYGDHSQISANYRAIEKDYLVYVGSEFWWHLTGDKKFYADLIKVFSSCADDYKETNLVAETLDALTQDIIDHPEILSAETEIAD